MYRSSVLGSVPGRHRLYRIALMAGVLVVASCGGGESSGEGHEAAASITTVAPPTTPAPRVGVRVDVPTAPPPTIDGTIAEAEWDRAVTASMSDEANVLFMRDDEVLYVAVVGSKIGAVNVVLATAAEVWILHSSAALGSAVYEAGASAWDLVHGFNWCCRDATDGSGPAELFAEERWEANIGFAGDPGVVEYAIALPWQEAAVAVSSIRDDTDRGFWPAEISLEAQDQLLGVPPSERRFNIDEWAILRPEE